MPVLVSENQAAYSVYQIVQNQFIMGVNGPTEINQLAIWEAIDRFKISNQRDTFVKVVAFGRHIRQAQKDQAE